ncbi:TolC family protein [Bullifex porci]|uniref:TolC family protein n=2 Tax=Bullifex TaxID=2815782 RepID=UPI0023F57C0E|nr:TolC family protein [Bullifex porci]MDD7255003.1 TolC family protein [Bullifex porci]MDY2740608.1 TolC family protein [Bullifex porci]
MKKFILFIVVLLISNTLFATETYNYDSLASSLRLNNTKLQAAYQDVVQAKLDTKDAKANYHPTIDLTVSGSYIINPIGPITVNASELGLPYNQYITLYKGMENTLYQTSLSLQQPIFTWGKISNGVKALKEVESVRSLQLTDTENQLNAELKSRLSAIYYMDDIISLLNEQKSYADRLVELAHAAQEQGIMLAQEVKENEINALQVDVTLSEINAQYSSNLTALRTMTGLLDLTREDISYIPDEESFYSLAKEDRNALIKSATSQSQPTLQMLSHMQSAMEYSEKVSKASVYWKPDFALQVSASYGGSRLPLVETDWYRQDDYNGMVTVAFKTTVWDGGKALNNIKRSESNVANAVISRDEAINTIITTLSEQFANQDMAIAKISYLDLKEETLVSKVEQKILLQSYGNASEADVLNAKIELTTCRLERLQEKLKLAQASYLIEYLTGRSN